MGANTIPPVFEDALVLCCKQCGARVHEAEAVGPNRKFFEFVHREKRGEKLGIQDIPPGLFRCFECERKMVREMLGIVL